MEKQGQADDDKNLTIADKQEVEYSVQVREDISRISSLPDCLLLHILSFLKMPEAINTSLLSKRWRYLWKLISCLDFRIEQWERKTDRATFISRSLSSYDGFKIKGVLIWCSYEDTDDLEIDSWMNFAMEHNVEKLKLDLTKDGFVSEDEWSEYRYKLPQSLYNCTSIISLAVSFCDLNMPAASIHLISLKTLHLELLELSNEAITWLTSNCPRLQHLSICACNMYSDLNITITNENLEYLTLQEYYTPQADSEVLICAPFLVQLNLWNGFPRAYRFKKMNSLKVVNFCELSYIYDPDMIYDEKFASHVSVGIIRDIYYVQELWICLFLVQVMSLRAVQGMHPLYLGATCLTLETELTKWELPGISYILESSPRLETLYISIPETKVDIKLSDDVKHEFAFEEKDFWASKEFNFPATLHKLVSVRIDYVAGTEQYVNVVEDLKKLENAIIFAQFLLKNANILKKMIIRCGKDLESNNEVLHKLTEELLCSPRASADVTVDII